ncbi:hypothetical protein DNI29_06355 [Hymenobacter sediminis]|uniref:hypothetical protein n=1 Tax=Hymenobacter sediminis TaxID=2218621 RepID=UPI000DA6B1AB|nr:hypothetical protein [Hymenobacter sediminis]RPD50409.1 hypothetical protein DNI29_06355 [Hymenobacter sediminis]
MNQIPENLTEFLYWVKAKTELFWSINPGTSKNKIVCENWLFGAKWVGLSEKQVNDVEKKYSIAFTPEHREFLRILHTIDRKEKVEYTETFDEDAEVLIEERPFFYNWLEDDEEIRYRLDWPFTTIYDDVTGRSKVWLKSWGERPAHDEDIKQIYSDWFEKAPKLLPLTSHRFIVSGQNLSCRPVLSVWGADTIVYGWNLRSYLLHELYSHLNIGELIYDKGYAGYYYDFKEEVKHIFENDSMCNEVNSIPYWGEIIL